MTLSINKKRIEQIRKEIHKRTGLVFNESDVSQVVYTALEVWNHDEMVEDFHYWINTSPEPAFPDNLSADDRLGYEFAVSCGWNKDYVDEMYRRERFRLDDRISEFNTQAKRFLDAVAKLDAS